MKDIDIFLMKLHKLLIGILEIDQAVFDKRWKHMKKEYAEWISSLPAQISPLTRNLEILRRVCNIFSDPELKNNLQLQSLVLENTADVGQEIQVQLGGQKYQVKKRTITDDFMVLYELKDQSGNVIIKTFID